MPNSFFKRVIHKPPILFPLLALFHFVLLAYQLWLNHDEPLHSLAWLQPLWVCVFAVAWLFACDLKKWAAYSYIAATTVNLILIVLAGSRPGLDYYSSALWFIAVIFCIPVFVYFKRFE